MKLISRLQYVADFLQPHSCKWNRLCFFPASLLNHRTNKQMGEMCLVLRCFGNPADEIQAFCQWQIIEKGIVLKMCFPTICLWFLVKLFCFRMLSIHLCSGNVFMYIILSRAITKGAPIDGGVRTCWRLKVVSPHCKCSLQPEWLSHTIHITTN